MLHRRKKLQEDISGWSNDRLLNWTITCDMKLRTVSREDAKQYWQKEKQAADAELERRRTFVQEYQAQKIRIIERLFGCFFSALFFLLPLVALALVTIAVIILLSTWLPLWLAVPSSIAVLTGVIFSFGRLTPEFRLDQMDVIVNSFLIIIFTLILFPVVKKVKQRQQENISQISISTEIKNSLK